MKEKLINFLVCPQCKGNLSITADREDSGLPWREIMDGDLICDACSASYKIDNGVPRMAIGSQSQDVKETIDGFGWEWLKFGDQITDTYMTEKTNFLDFIYPIDDSFFKDKLILDAGCGMGRFMKLGAEFGSKEIIGVDLSNSVNFAYRITRELPNAHVVQADILNLPFVKIFDYIFSIGVLHHMKDPQQGFSQLTKFLGSNGTISAWVYSKENNQWVINFLSPLRKHVTSRLPRGALYKISQVLGFGLYACLQFIYRPANKNKFGLKLGRFLPYNDYLYYSSRLSYNSIVSVVFDHLVPQLSFYISRSEFESWFRDEGLRAVEISSRNNMSWRGKGLLR